MGKADSEQAFSIEIRACRDRDDEELSLAIYNEVWPLDSVTMAEVDSFRAAAHDYGDHLGFLDGRPVGSAAIAIFPGRPSVGFSLVTVLPAFRQRGVGTALYEAVSTWLAERGLSELDVTVPENDPTSLSFAQRRGFREVERNGRMVLELAEVEPPPVDPPPGIDIVTWAARPDTVRGIYEVACEAFPDIPHDREREGVEPFEDWVEHELRGSGDRADATFVALAGDEVVGYAKFSLTAARPTVASHDMTGVKRAWRGRGIAGALKRAQVAWAKEAGFETLQTANEMRNEPIRRLNARLGYRPAPGRVILRGPISPGCAP